MLKGLHRVTAEFKPMAFLSVHPNSISGLGGSDEAWLKEIHASSYEGINMDRSTVDKFEFMKYILIDKKEY